MNKTNGSSTIMLRIDGYDVEVTIRELEFFDDPVDDGHEKPIVGNVVYEYDILYDFQEQESYDSVYRQVDQKVPERINELIETAVTAMINTVMSETNTSPT